MSPLRVLDFPREIRDHIYVYCFPVADNQQLVTPDALRSRRSTPGCDTSHTINGTIALLRTCRQVYEEASEMLYKNKTFFDDVQHGNKKTTCNGRSKDGLDYKIMSDAMLCFQPEFVYCDICDLKAWLEVIGICGRRLVSKVQLNFSAEDYATSGIDQENILRLFPSPNRDRTKPVAGHITASALKFLLEEGNVQRLTISISWSLSPPSADQTGVSRAAVRRRREFGDSAEVEATIDAALNATGSDSAAAIRLCRIPQAMRTIASLWGDRGMVRRLRAKFSSMTVTEPDIIAQELQCLETRRLTLVEFEGSC